MPYALSRALHGCSKLTIFPPKTALPTHTHKTAANQTGTGMNMMIAAVKEMTSDVSRLPLLLWLEEEMKSPRPWPPQQQSPSSHRAQRNASLVKQKKRARRQNVKTKERKLGLLFTPQKWTMAISQTVIARRPAREGVLGLRPLRGDEKMKWQTSAA